MSGKEDSTAQWAGVCSASLQDEPETHLFLYPKIWLTCEQQGNRDPMPFIGQGNPRPAVGCTLSVSWGSDTVPGHAVKGEAWVMRDGSHGLRRWVWKQSASKQCWQFYRTLLNLSRNCQESGSWALWNHEIIDIWCFKLLTSRYLHSNSNDFLLP